MKFCTVALLVDLISHDVGLSLAGSTSSDEDDGRKTIGYRSISQGERNLMRQAGTIVRSRNSAAAHLGKGVYISNSPYVFQRKEEGMEPVDITVTITAKRYVFESFPKVWVPEELMVLGFETGDRVGERQDQISGEQLKHYITDQGLDPSRTLRLGKVLNYPEYVMQMLVPPEMVVHDENGVPIQIKDELEIRVEDMDPDDFPLSIDYDEWEGVKGLMEYTEKTLDAGTKFLVEKATKAATEAGQYLKSFSATPASEAIATAPSSAAAAEAIADAVDTTKRCAEGVGHLYRERPELVDAEDFISAYGEYANARRTQVTFGKLRLVKAMERNKILVTDAAGNLGDAPKVAEARQKVEESKGLLEEAEAEVANFKTDHERVDAVLRGLKDGDDLARTQGTEILVENPRAVWAKIRNYPPAKEGSKQLTLDTAIADEAAIAQEVYSISQEAVDEAKALVGELVEAVKALDATDEKDDEARRKKGEEAKREKEEEAQKEKEEEAQRRERDEEAKRKEEAEAKQHEDAKQKAVESAKKLEEDPSGGSWLGKALGGVGAGLAALGGAAFASGAAIGGTAAGAGALGGAAGAGALGGAVGAEGVTLLSAAESSEVMAADVAEVVAEVDPQMALDILLDSAPAPPTTLPGAGPVSDGPLLGKRHDVFARALSAAWAFQVAGPTLQRTVEAAALLALKEARIEMQVPGINRIGGGSDAFDWLP